jgi:restriction system protein
VLHLLKSMGYAGQLGRAEHAGRTGDGGFDGILYLDRLELERVYVQAKRWAGPVGASTIRDFAGSMDGEAATKGVVTTTSTFTAEARNYLKKSPKAIRLVDGTELAALMIEFGVGVSRARTLVVPRVDEDFFDEGLT